MLDIRFPTRQVRIPPQRLHPLLQRFYAFFLAVGIPVLPVKKTRVKGLASRSEHERDNLAMSRAGVSPVPLAPGASSIWHLMQRWQYVYASLFIAAWLMYFGLQFHAQFFVARYDNARVLRGFFSIFQFLALISSTFLAHDILSQRTIGTRIAYTLRRTTQKKHVDYLIKSALRSHLLAGLCLVLVGIASDYISRPDSIATIYRALPRKERSVWMTPLEHLWAVSAVAVRFQQVAGIVVVSSLLSMHLIRIDSCLRGLKRPGTTAYQASVQVFDIDVALADLSHSVDLRLSMLLASNFLSFFFEAIFLVNNHQNDTATNGAASDPTAASDLISLAFPGLSCAWLLLGCSGINSSCQQLKLVATRFAVFQERERIRLLYQHKAQESKKARQQRAKQQSLASPIAPTAETVNGQQQQQASGATRPTAAMPIERGHVYQESNPFGHGANEKDGKKKQKQDQQLQQQENKEGDKDVAIGVATSADPHPANFSVGPSASSSSSPSPAPAVPSESLECAKIDQDGDGDIEADLGLLSLRLRSFLDYLMTADISLRLATIQFDAKVTWGFFLVAGRDTQRGRPAAPAGGESGARSTSEAGIVALMRCVVLFLDGVSAASSVFTLLDIKKLDFM